ncbi:MAG: hypothetical protein ACFE0O_05350 [Opitutales bacterium]
MHFEEMLQIPRSELFTALFPDSGEKFGLDGIDRVDALPGGLFAVMQGCLCQRAS